MADPLEPGVGRIIALVVSRAAAGLGGALAGIGLVHLVIAGNPWGLVLLVVGLGLFLGGIHHAARLSADREHHKDRH
jgi:fatty acid desaturase